jgi:hypothetical protein
MADITDFEVIHFVDEIIRPMAEDFRALKAEVDSATNKWFEGINAKVPNDAGSILQDDRASGGVSRLSGADITNFITQMLAYQTQLNQSGVAGVISKPCVRAMTVLD